MSSNLLKRGYTNLKQDDARVINVNELMAKRMEELASVMEPVENDEFEFGLTATVVDAEAFSEEEADAEQSNVIKGGVDTAQIREKAGKEAEEILEQARAQAAEIEKAAIRQATAEKERIFEEARKQGYEEGVKQAREEASRMEADFHARNKQLETEYQALIDELEPQFVDTITGIYEHIFQVELSSHHDILCHLIENTLRKTEGTGDYLVHVSREDYPYVSMQKKQLAAGITSPNSTLEIVEDMTLSENECLIETAGGIFDCGLGTQLAELRQKLRLLSYEK